MPVIIKVLKTHEGQHICTECNDFNAVSAIGSKYSTGGMIVHQRFCKECLGGFIDRLTKLKDSLN